MRRAGFALLAVAITGCGGGSGGSKTPSHPAAGPSRESEAGPYRWLVPTEGAPPSVSEENRHPGTTSWRLPGPSADVAGLRYGTGTGYVAQEAVGPGQTEKIYVSAPGARRVRIQLYRMGWYGGSGGREVLVSNRLRVRHQPRCTHRFTTGLTECKWHPTLSFKIPPALPSGVYIAKLSTNRGASDCLFVVLARAPQPLLAQLPTSTYQAYNAWGGNSLYPGGADRVRRTGTTQGIEVSDQRPYDSITGAGQFFARDVAMVRFLERYGFPVSYTTSASVDEDPGQLAGHKALIDFGHSEYWSERQANGFAHARDAGTSLLFFGSDTMAWRVRYAAASRAASESGSPGHSLVAYKEHAALDRNRANPTGAFADRGASLTGSAYLGCITPRVHRVGPPAYRYYAWTPSAGLQPSWLYRGTRITAATRIPGIVGYELDERTSASPPGTEIAGSGVATCMSHTEPGEPFRRLGYGIGETTISTAHSGAIVFDTGTLGWELGLEPVPSASPDAPLAPDPRVVAITRNVLNRVLRAG